MVLTASVDALLADRARGALEGICSKIENGDVAELVDAATQSKSPMHKALAGGMNDRGLDHVALSGALVSGSTPDITTTKPTATEIKYHPDVFQLVDDPFQRRADKERKEDEKVERETPNATPETAPVLKGPVWI